MNLVDDSSRCLRLLAELSDIASEVYCIFLGFILI